MCPIDLGMQSTCDLCPYEGECFDGPSNEDEEEIYEEDFYDK